MLDEEKAHYEYGYQRLLWKALARQGTWRNRLQMLPKEELQETATTIVRILASEITTKELLSFLNSTDPSEFGKATLLQAKLTLAGDMSPPDIITNFLTVRDPELELLGESDRESIRNHLFRAFYRAGQRGRAEQVAADLMEQHDNPVAETILALDKGDVARCESLTQPDDADLPYQHDLLPQTIWTNAFTELRRTNPRPTYYYGSDFHLLLTSAGVEMAKASKILKSLTGNRAKVTDVTKSLTGCKQAISIEHKRFHFILAISGRFREVDLDPYDQMLLMDHRQTLSILALRPSDDRHLKLIKKLVLAVAPANALGIYYQNRLLVSQNSDWRELLRSDGFNVGKHDRTYLELGTGDQNVRPRWERMRETTARLVAGDMVGKRISARVGYAPFRFAQEFRVIAVHEGDYEISLVCELETPCATLPHGKIREVFYVALNDVHEWLD